MATATLPYPNMDFTPLDILTAAEMDQMVANDQYLATFANGLANGSNLSDGVIQTRHIDFTTLNSITYQPGDVVTFSNVMLPLAILGTDGAQTYTIPLNKSTSFVTGATIAVSGGSESYFNTSSGGFGRAKNGTYTGTLNGGALNFAASITDSNGKVAQYSTGAGVIGQVKITFS